MKRNHDTEISVLNFETKSWYRNICVKFCNDNIAKVLYRLIVWFWQHTVSTKYAMPIINSIIKSKWMITCMWIKYSSAFDTLLYFDIRIKMLRRGDINQRDIQTLASNINWHDIILRETTWKSTTLKTKDRSTKIRGLYEINLLIIWPLSLFILKCLFFNLLFDINSLSF